MREIFATLAFTFLLIYGAFYFLLIYGAFYLGSIQCASVAEQMKVPYSYKVLQGCMIEPKPGQWVPLANYRVL